MRADYVAVDKIILRFFKKLVALAFLPTNAVALAFKSLVQSELSPPYCDLEGWHMKVQKKLQYRNHSNLWTFINGLKVIDKDASLEETQINHGLLIKVRSREHMLKERSLKRMRAMYDNNQYDTDVDYVTALSSYMIEFH
mmetsp:Transcript_18040/g.25976  ORF Transcript_18040/g.25976 Transcript_18040/m.25976 type:complete len:140 (+) Transcript_18040:1004-1423(+)